MRIGAGRFILTSQTWTDMVELTDRTRRAMAALFPQHEVAKAEDLLIERCGKSLPGMSASAAALERVRLAALRVSGGHLNRLHDAVALAQIDWRDLLVAAGFADDVHAHEAWRPRHLDVATIELWMGGELPYGVEFSPSDSVEIAFGPLQGQRGAIITLTALEPEPLYLLELGTGEEVERYQRVLRTAG
jgi:hypothetical protein